MFLFNLYLLLNFCFFNESYITVVLVFIFGFIHVLSKFFHFHLLDSDLTVSTQRPSQLFLVPAAVCLKKKEGSVIDDEKPVADHNM